MSAHGQHDAEAGPHAGEDDHGETSSDDFPADEPRSPGWLPLLGGAFLLAGVFAFVVFAADSDSAGKDSPVEGEQPAVPAAPRPAGLPAQRPAPPVRPGNAMPAAPVLRAAP